MTNDQPRTNCIIPVTWNRLRGIYVIEIAEPLFADFQQLLIAGGKERNMGMFFTVDEKRLTKEECIAAAVEIAKRILKKQPRPKMATES